MAKFYYGNGVCTIEGSDIMGIEINYSGNITIDDKTSDSFALMAGINKILIFPVGKGTLNELFDYNGELKIISVIAIDNNTDKVPTTIHRVMDYSELLGNAEDLTVNSEDLNSTHSYGKKPSKTSLVQKIIPNLSTSTFGGTLYLESGEVYNGYFHIHLEDNGAAMTGSEHNDDSQDLYIKQMKDGEVIDKLVPTRNTNRVSPVWKLQNKQRHSKRRK